MVSNIINAGNTVNDFRKFFIKDFLANGLRMSYTCTVPGISIVRIIKIISVRVNIIITNFGDFGKCINYFRIRNISIRCSIINKSVKIIGILSNCRINSIKLTDNSCFRKCIIIIGNLSYFTCFRICYSNGIFNSLYECVIIDQFSFNTVAVPISSLIALSASSTYFLLTIWVVLETVSAVSVPAAGAPTI